MFTRIIKALGKVEKIEKKGQNIDFTLSAPFVNELKIDQSVAHNGVCLTVIDLSPNTYTVTAIAETLNKTNLNAWQVGTLVNLERCMQLGGRLDGHIVQGHVDTTGVCTAIKEIDGSWEFEFSYNASHVTVNKGSITINGVSLTVVQSKKGFFSVCIIPYTYEHTSFHQLKVGDRVNLEFDIIGKYVERLLSERN